MFGEIFFKILKMSLIATIVIVFVMIARVFLRKVPKIFSYALGVIVLFCLICPFTFKSVYSLLQSKEEITTKMPDTLIISTDTKGNQGIEALVNSDTQNAITAPLEEAIHSAILESSTIENGVERVAFESHFILAMESEENDKNSEEIQTVTVYAMVLDLQYPLMNGKIEDMEEGASSHGPRALTFDVREDGTYLLREYWVPGDGSDYKRDIEKKFPKAIWEDALDTQKFITVQEQNVYKQLIEACYIDADSMITKIIDNILNGQGELEDWELQAEQRELVFYGDYMLIYAYERFLNRNESKEKAYIMESACRTILNQFNEDIDFAGKRGQQWFDSYLAALKDYEEEEGVEFIKNNMPKGYLLLTMEKRR